MSMDDLSEKIPDEFYSADHTGDDDPRWHVWLVDGYFYAAATLQEARKYSSDQWGTEMDEQQWEDLSCDLVGFHQHATSWDDHDEDNPDCTMRERALEMMEAGESLPLLVAIELN